MLQKSSSRLGWIKKTSCAVTFMLLFGVFCYMLPSGLMAIPDVSAGGGPGFDCGTASNIHVSATECYGVMFLYEQLGGAGWTTKTNWKTDSNVCTWYGVGCTNLSGTDRVTSISLSNNNLTGTIQGGFQLASYMRSFDVSNNHIRGQLDTNLSAWTDIQNIDLSDNNLYGDIPSSWYASWPHSGSQYIDLSNNCINPTGYTPAMSMWVATDINMSPQNICLVYQAAGGLTLSGDVFQVLSSGGNGTLVEAIPNYGYVFTERNDGVTTTGRTDTNVTGSSIIIAYSARYIFDVRYAWDVGGTVSGNILQTAVVSGNSTTPVTAVPDPGYIFAGWDDGRTDNPRTDVVTGDMSPKALFAFNSHLVTYSATTGGMIIGDDWQIIASGGNGTAVIAMPASGYDFDEWSDNSTDNPRTDLNVTTGMSFVALFSPTPVSTGSSGSGSSGGGSHGGGGGNGGGGPSIDSCPEGDTSPSYYDGSCGVVVGKSGSNSGSIDTSSVNISKTDSCLSSGKSTGYCLAQQYGLKAFKRLLLSDMDAVVTRGEMARLLAEFSIIVLKKTPNTHKDCHFTDSKNKAARQVCQLNLMGIDSNFDALLEFQPDLLLTNEQFSMIISRLVYGDGYDTSASEIEKKMRYKKHARMLSKIGIVAQDDGSGMVRKNTVLQTFLALLENK